MILFEISETIRQAYESIGQNKLRSLLASLGVVIGISFVILMGWVLGGLDKSLQDTFNLIGVDMLYVDKWEWAGGHNWKLLETRKAITINQANEFSRRINTAEFAIPVARQWGSRIKYRNETITGISIQGTRSEYGLTSAGSVIDGRFFSQSEDQYSSNVAVIGYGVYTSLFPHGDAVGKELKIDGHKFVIVGVVKKQSTLLLDFMDKQIFVPLNSFISTFGKLNRTFSIAVKAGDVSMLDEVRAETEGLMREIRNVPPGKPNDFSINETKAFEDSVATFRLYVWGIGIGMTVLSFIVGIIGIMNIMFVSVTERTKEIGIRKAIGAKKRSILLQFILESAALCFTGAILAFIICSLIIYAVATILPKYVPETSFLPQFMSIDQLIIASFVSIFVGVLAGLIPAARASNLDPVDALRYE